MKVRGTTINTPIARHAVTDDTCVSKKAWSSKNTVDMLCPAIEENGNVVVCEPVEGYPLTVTANEGATKIIRCGKNLFNFKGEVKQIQYTSDGDIITRWGFEVKLPAGTYTLHAEKVTSSTADRWIYGCVTDANGNVKQDCHLLVAQKFYNKTVTLVEGDKILIYNGTSNATQSTTTNILTKYFDIQVEKGSAATAYEPYCGGEFAVGAEIPAISGVNYLYADSGEIEVNGRADVKAIIEKLTNAIISAGGKV